MNREQHNCTFGRHSKPCQVHFIFGISSKQNIYAKTLGHQHDLRWKRINANKSLNFIKFKISTNRRYFYDILLLHNVILRNTLQIDCKYIYNTKCVVALHFRELLHTKSLQIQQKSKHTTKYSMFNRLIYFGEQQQS